MANIYISSTYSDLLDAREKVYHTLRKMGHDVIAMEDYVATDQRPIDKCLADVANCDIYIGIFAWRYGYIPPNQKQSITELEFREALRTEKPKLLFLLHEEAPWPRNLIDRDNERIEAFRIELCREYIVSFFRTSDELTSLVSVSVANFGKDKSLDIHDYRTRKQMTEKMFDEKEYHEYLNSYLQYVITETQKIRLIGFSHGRTDVEDPQIDKLFVPLNMIASTEFSGTERWSSHDSERYGLLDLRIYGQKRQDQNILHQSK